MIKFKDLPQQKHEDFLEDMEILSSKVYKQLSILFIKDLVQALRKEKLVKSELKRGWTGKIPKIEMDFSELVDGTISRYLNALKYLLLGRLAGDEAREAAEEIGIANKIVPGVIPAAYLEAIDTHSEYGERITGKELDTLKPDMVKESMDNISKRSERFIDESFLKLRNRLVSSLEMVAASQNDENIATAHEEAHQSGLGAAVENVVDKLNGNIIAKSVKMVTDSYLTDWNRMVSVNMSMASSVGTHQVVTEIYGAQDDDVRVALVTMRDEKVCVFCAEHSKNPDGSFKLYRLGDFEPAGYNYSRKKAEWKLCIPREHFGCRCSLVYVPKGFVITNAGDVSPKKKD